MTIQLGNTNVHFMIQDNKLIYPNYVQNGLVLHYDFQGMTNEDITRNVAKDLSGNGKDGVLNNFDYTEESGYTGNSLKFDGVDDFISVNLITTNSFTAEVVLDEIITDKIGTIFNFALPDSILRLSLKKIGKNTIASGYYDGIRWITNEINIPEGKSHVCVVYNIHGENEREVDMDFYLSGSPSPSTSSSNGSIGYVNATRFTQIGYQSTTQTRPNEEYFDEMLFSAKIYNRPLSTEEIQHNYQIESLRTEGV